MDHFQKFKRQVSWYIFGSFILFGVFVTALWWFGTQNSSASPLILLAITAGVFCVVGFMVARSLTSYALTPLMTLWQAIIHVSPGHDSAAPPNLDEIKIARELVTSLVLQVYQLASQQGQPNQATTSTAPADFIVNHLPVPMVVLSPEQAIVSLSEPVQAYTGLKAADLIGRALFDCINLEFPSDMTLEAWLTDCRKNKVTDLHHWERVRVRSREGKLLHQCDMAAYYNKDNTGGTECIISFLDRSEAYTKDDQSMSFVALAVHELRTPLTMLRGYIEVFEEELADKLDPTQKDFMAKMEVSAQQLAAFINNILNVARIDENQLQLQLTEAPWEESLRQATEPMELRARMYGITIEYEIAKGLPTVGVDRVSIIEVVNNLLDNAIKYSGTSKRIVVKSGLNKDGVVETTVQDFGVGIPESVLPNLFEKFYRNHRTRASIGGTGLGLYLCKAIIGAHGGQIWAESKAGQGSTFGFTLVPYSQLAAELKNSNNTGITRSAHGWIKNHSLYRR